MTPALEAAYAEPHRRYHTRRHIEDCLAELAAVEGLTPAERRVLEWAIWWHDAVYDPTCADNEARNAELAERELAALGADPAGIGEVARLIRLTAGHRTDPVDRIGAVLVSIDLAILGAPRDAYDAYAQAVRAENAHVRPAAFAQGRRRVLADFLDGPAINPDPSFRARLEAPARANLARELASLG